MNWMCGDIGGTNARLAAFNGALTHERTWPSGGSPDLYTLLCRWLDETGCEPVAACFAMAGPVRANRCVATNLPWVVDGEELTRRLGFPVVIVNDFHAAALGVRRLASADRIRLFGGEPDPAAPIAVIGAGTGLGEALLLPDGQVVAGEGGHVEFGPTDERELRLARWLIRREGRASWESVLSGPGLVRLATFLAEEAGAPAPSASAADATRQVITHHPEAVAWFAELYGAAAGNAALRSLAGGGVYLTGGLAPALLPALQGGGFRRRFLGKGKVAAAIADVPVYVVTHGALGLLGAAEVLERRKEGS